MRRSHVLPPGLAVTLLAAGLGPRRLRRAGRAGLGVYGAAVAAVSGREAANGARRDAAALPAVFATMHLATGFGFLYGCLRFGPPWRALLAVTGLGRRSA
jgi:hypothetical protein